MVTGAGASYTWAENSRENWLTPFANDPITDPTAEAIYVRDDDWRGVGCDACPAAPHPAIPTLGDAPRRRRDPLRAWGARNRAGARRPRRAERPVKLTTLTTTNRPRARRLASDSYGEWLLGPPRPATRGSW